MKYKLSERLYEAIVVHNGEELRKLRSGYHEDMAKAESEATKETVGKNHAYIFPDIPWARRVSGVFANHKARQKEEIAHAIITQQDNILRISVRAPLSDPRHADTLCKKFATGGGRAAAAGINALPKEELSRFYDEFIKTYQ